MYDTMIELRGNLAADATLRPVGDTEVANFRVAVTPRVHNRTTGEWADAGTQWFTVSAWRRLAANAGASLRRGDAVIVRGRLTVRDWVDQGGAVRTSLEVDADYIAHDLARGTSRFVRGAASAQAGPMLGPLPFEAEPIERAADSSAA